MKKLLLAVAVIAAVFFVGCKGAGGDPKAVLVNFFDALGKKDIAAARKLATTDSKSMLDMMEMGMSGDKKDAKDEKYDKDKMEFGEPKIEGDKATVVVKEKASGEQTTFTLKKESGAWKVAFDKASMMSMGMEKMKEKNVNVDSLGHTIDGLNVDSLSNHIKEGLDEMKSLDTLHK